MKRFAFVYALVFSLAAMSAVLPVFAAESAAAEEEVSNGTKIKEGAKGIFNGVKGAVKDGTRTARIGVGDIFKYDIAGRHFPGTFPVFFQIGIHDIPKSKAKATVQYIHGLPAPTNPDMRKTPVSSGTTPSRIHTAHTSALYYPRFQPPCESCSSRKHPAPLRSAPSHAPL